MPSADGSVGRPWFLCPGRLGFLSQEHYLIIFSSTPVIYTCTITHSGLAIELRPRLRGPGLLGALLGPFAAEGRGAGSSLPNPRIIGKEQCVPCLGFPTTSRALQPTGHRMASRWGRRGFQVRKGAESGVVCGLLSHGTPLRTAPLPPTLAHVQWICHSPRQRTGGQWQHTGVLWYESGLRMG